MEEQSYLSNDLPIDRSAAACLRETTSWTRFLAVCFIIFIVAASFVCIAMMFLKDLFISSLANFPVSIASIGITALIIICVIALLVFSLSTHFLYRFSDQTRDAVLQKEQQLLEKGIAALKNYLIISGIFAILSLISGILQLFKL